MKHPVKALFLGGLFLIALSILVYQLPPVQSRLGWRIDIAKTSLRTLLHPIGAMPTAVPVAELPAPVLHLTPGPSPTATPPAPTPSLSPTRSLPTPTPPPTATPEPLPERMLLEAPRYETQDWNNCGPASLALYLRYYGWSGDQFTISDLIKPLRNDRNVNIDELAQYVLDNLPGYDVAIRVGGTPELLKQFIAAGIPVMIEESFYLDEAFWYNDDRWAGHYLLVTGYDDASGTFVTQDTFVAPNRRLTYDQLNQNWQSFNRAYLLVFPSERSADVQNLLGQNWDLDANRQNALDMARAEAEADPQNALAWFNVGSNLVYFQRYNEAAAAYDQARSLDLPQRMLRYQFGPFLAYFHSGRNDDLMALVDYALSVTDNSEEALLWQGWGRYRQQDIQGALASFQKALEYHPNYGDALYAIGYIQQN